MSTSGSCTLSSKKQISPIIAAAADTAAATAKAAAAISASMSQPTIHDQLKQQHQHNENNNTNNQSPSNLYTHTSPSSLSRSPGSSTTQPSEKNKNRNHPIKMIDTDIDDIDDLDLDHHNNLNEIDDRSSKLFDDKEHGEIMMLSLPRSYNEHVPPSFNTALRSHNQQHQHSQQLHPNPISSIYKHQYQNDIDLHSLVKR